MNRRLIPWLISGFLYLAFVAWYTDFGGPITDTEISEWKQSMSANGASTERIAYFEQFLREDTGRQFLMINAIDFNQNPPEVAGAQPGETAEQLMARYMEHMFVQLLKRACHPVLVGTAPFTVIDVAGIEGAETWEQGAVVRYKSRRAFMQIISHPDTMARHDFKTAALEKTIAYPIETQLYLGDLRLILGLLLLVLNLIIDTLRRSTRS